MPSTTERKQTQAPRNHAPRYSPNYPETLYPLTMVSTWHIFHKPPTEGPRPQSVAAILSGRSGWQRERCC